MQNHENHKNGFYYKASFFLLVVVLMFLIVFGFIIISIRGEISRNAIVITKLNSRLSLVEPVQEPVKEMAVFSVPFPAYFSISGHVEGLLLDGWMEETIQPTDGIDVKTSIAKDGNAIILEYKTQTNTACLLTEDDVTGFKQSDKQTLEFEDLTAGVSTEIGSGLVRVELPKEHSSDTDYIVCFYDGSSGYYLTYNWSLPSISYQVDDKSLLPEMDKIVKSLQVVQ